MIKSEDKTDRDKKTELFNLYQTVRNCRNCKLGQTRQNFVFGEGATDAKILFIGEGPGRQEDLLGRPFVGRSGELLTSIIEKGMLLKREEVYIANIVKCRPTVDLKGFKDRPPDREEVASCNWILRKQIEIIQPQVIITLGNPAAKFILQTSTGITRLRGQFFEYNRIKVMPTYHPSYVLRNGGENSPLKKDVWHDIKLVLNYLNMKIPGP